MFYDYEEYLDYHDMMVESAEINLDKALVQLNFYNQLRTIEEDRHQIACFESGDDSNLWEYYESGEGGLTNKIKKALLAAWKKLKELVGRIKNIFIKNRKQGTIEASDTVVVKKPFAIMIKKLKSLWSAAKGVIIKGKTKLKEDHKFQALVALLGTAAIGGAIFAIRKKKSDGNATESSKKKEAGMEEVSGSEVETVLDVVEDIHDTIEKTVEQNIKTAEQANTSGTGTQLALPMFDSEVHYSNISELQNLVKTTEKVQHAVEIVYDKETAMTNKQIHKAKKFIAKNSKFKNTINPEGNNLDELQVSHIGADLKHLTLAYRSIFPNDFDKWTAYLKEHSITKEEKMDILRTKKIPARFDALFNNKGYIFKEIQKLKTLQGNTSLTDAEKRKLKLLEDAVEILRNLADYR